MKDFKDFRPSKEVKEDYRDIMRLHDDDPEWVKIVKKHKRAFDAVRKGKKLPLKVEDEILIWADLRGSDKDDKRFIDNLISVLKEGTTPLKEADSFDKSKDKNVDQILKKAASLKGHLANLEKLDKKGEGAGELSKDLKKVQKAYADFNYAMSQLENRLAY